MSETDEIMKELAHSDVKIDVMCYIECRKDGHGKQFCAEICKEERRLLEG